MASQLNIFDLLTPVKVKPARLFWNDFEDKRDFGSDKDMKEDMHLYFKEYLESAKKSIKGFWYLYGTQLERDKGPYVDFGTVGKDGIVIDSNLLVLLQLEIPSYWNLRAAAFRDLEEKYGYIYDEPEH